VKRRHYLSFGYKLTLSNLLLVIVPVVIIGYFAYSITLQSVQEKTDSAFRGTLKQIKDNIVYNIDDLRRVSDLLYQDQDLQEKLRRYGDGWISYEVTTKFLIPKLVNTVKSTGIPLWLSVYLQNETLPEITASQDQSVDPMRTKTGNYEIYHLSRISGEAWYSNLPIMRENYDPGVLWRQIDNDSKFRNISLLRRMDDVYDMRQVGFIRITVKIDELFKTIDVDKLNGVSHIVVYDDAGSMIYSSGQRTAEQYLTLEERIPETNWKIAAYVPTRVFQQDANKVRNLTILVCMGSFLVLALMSYLLSKFFARKVRNIVDVLKAFREGDFNARIRESGRDEFAQIASAFNKMGQNTDQLIQEMYITNIQKREAELTALQAQINPHFLYNTLSSISRLAEFGEIDTLHQMVLALAKFYRLTLNEGRLIITISDELQQAQAYIDIQKIKYGGRLEFDCRIDENVLQYDTIKLILQPFIENVIEHSWFGDGRIQFKLWADLVDGCIVFKIIDDGVGMTQKTIEDIFNPNGIQVGYGIRNVDERIKLQFGVNYGVTIASRPGIGTTVQIVIPAYKNA
jgi:two-component system sensor histidine kinase YesM